MFPLKGLLCDLRQRCTRLIVEIEKTQAIPDEIQDYREGVLEALKNINMRIENFLGDSGLGVPLLQKYYLHHYRRLAERVLTFESGAALAVIRYSERDRLITRVCHRIAGEISYPYPPPICAALSDRHYYTTPGNNLIYVPVVEPFHLLGLSDIYHEFGHIILARNDKTLVQPMNTMIDSWFFGAWKEAEKEGKARNYRETLAEFKQLWKRYWVLEFASDLVAAYCAGPAYGWANVRLCANMSTDLFADGTSVPSAHPADDARNTAICSLLGRLGFQDAADAIMGQWKDFTLLVGQSQPQEYAIKYPSGLLRQIEDFIILQCTNLGLVAYSEPHDPPIDLHITRLLNTAWNKFNDDPDGFATWESAQIAEAGNILGL